MFGVGMSFSISRTGTAITALLIAGFAPNVARADDADLVLQRVQLLEKELAAVKRENEALRHIKRLREENAALAKSLPPANVPQGVATGNPREAYAADVPVYAKAAVPVERGQLRLWGEGGAIWSGGDPIESFYQHIDLTFNSVSNEQRFFPLVPKVGWEAATGFDYRFGGSPWHVSGQFRYGEARTSVSSSDSASVLIAPLPGTLVTVTNDERATHKETHWLADLAFGRDVIGGAADALQLKFGVRVAELRAETNLRNMGTESGNGITFVGAALESQQHRFLGAGPRLGVEGSAPMGHGWSFDYLGDMAVLFGTQNFQRIQTFNASVQGVPFDVGSPPADTVDKFGTVFNPDIQLGVSYWMTQSAKVSLSYRLDAYFNVLYALDAQNDPTRLHRIDRYTHGPRLAVTAQF